MSRAVDSGPGDAVDPGPRIAFSQLRVFSDVLLCHADHVAGPPVSLVTEALYAQRAYVATDMLAVLADKRDPAEEVCRQITVPDGTVASMALAHIVCDQYPHLWARRVNDLRWADPDRADAGLVWGERKER